MLYFSEKGLVLHQVLLLFRYSDFLMILLLVRAHFSKRGILKVCKAFLSRICHAVVFTQFGYADSKSTPCQALFLVFPLSKLRNKMAAKIADKVSIIMIIHHVWVHSGHTNLTFVFKIIFLF